MATKFECVIIEVTNGGRLSGHYFYGKTIEEAMREIYENNMFSDVVPEGGIAPMSITIKVDGRQYSSDSSLYDRESQRRFFSKEGGDFNRYLNVLSARRWVMNNPGRTPDECATALLAEMILREAGESK